MSVNEEQSGAELQHSSLWQRNCRAVSLHVVLSVCSVCMCVVTLLTSRNLTIHIKEGFVLSDLLHVYATVWIWERSSVAFLKCKS